MRTGKQTVAFVKLSSRMTPFYNQTAFQYRMDRPARWLQKAIFFVLRKLEAFYIDQAETIERHTIDATTFIERLFVQQEELKRFFNRDAATLLIGAEDYATLMREAVASQMISFRAEYGFGREILGMEVRVIPWIRGCVVLPAEF